MGLLAQAGLFVRKPGIAPMDRCIRVSVGPKADCDLLRAALPGALAQARDGS
jgi:histidinol-phosphate aminotransferase